MKARINFEQTSFNLWIGTILFFIINFIIKTWGLSKLSMYNDEPFTVFYSQQSLSEILGRLKTDSNPFLHPFIIHYIFKIFGVTVYNAKMVSVIFSSLAGSLLFYMFGKRKMFEIGMYSGIIFLLSGLHLFYSHEIRGYAQLTFFTVLSFHYFIRLTENPKKKHIFILGLINLALIMTHYTTFILPLVQSVFILLYCKSNKNTVKYFIYSQILTVVVFLPWFFNVVVNNVPQAGKSWIAVPKLINTYHSVKLLGTNILLQCSVAAILIAIINVFTKNILKERFNNKLFWFLTASFWLSALISHVISQRYPIMLSKYLLFSSIGLFISIAYFIGNLKIPVYIRWVVFAVVVGIQISQFNVPKVKEDWPGRVKMVKNNKTQDTKVFVHEYWWYMSFTYYWNHEYFTDYKNLFNYMNKDGIKFMSSKGIGEYLNYEQPISIMLVLHQGDSFNDFNEVLKKYNYTLQWSDLTLIPHIYMLKRTNTEK